MQHRLATRQVDALCYTYTMLHDDSTERIGYLFLDTETTGLARFDQVWQIAWIMTDSSLATVGTANRIVQHSTAPSPWVLKNTSYVQGVSSTHSPAPLSACVNEIAVESGPNRSRFDRLYLVGSSPSFDDSKIAAHLRADGGDDAVPWHHPLDIGALVMGLRGDPRPLGLHDLATLTGIKNVKPHDAMSDATHVLDLFRWWRSQIEPLAKIA